MAITTRFLKWDNTPAHSPFSNIKTKFYNFEGPQVKKDVVKLIISGKGTGTLKVFFRTDEAGGAWNLWGTGVFLGALGTDIIELDALVGYQYDVLKYFGQNVKGIQFRLAWSSTTQNDFEIDDITIIYRPYRDIEVSEDDT